MRLFLITISVAALLLAGCDGPHEEAGEKADVAAGLSDSTGSLTAGPNERRGEKLDAIMDRPIDASAKSSVRSSEVAR